MTCESFLNMLMSFCYFQAMQFYFRWKLLKLFFIQNYPYIIVVISLKKFERYSKSYRIQWAWNIFFFQCCKEDQRKAVFISQTTRTQLKTVGEIIRNSDLTHCILVTCVSLDVVYLELNDGVKDVSDVSSGKAGTEGAKLLERMLLEWMNKKVRYQIILYLKIYKVR